MIQTTITYSITEEGTVIKALAALYCFIPSTVAAYTNTAIRACYTPPRKDPC